MPETSIASRMVKLFTEFPCAGTNDGDFGIEMPLEISDKSYEIIIQHIEFRRKCMNQGFDNLLELLSMHKATLEKFGTVDTENKDSDA